MKNNVVFSGSLSFIKLGELIQLLGSNGSTGILRTMSKYSETTGLIYFEKGNPINAANSNLTGLDALYSLFGWINANFEFSAEKVEVEKVIKKSRMEIILEGLRLLDDGSVDKLGPVSFDNDSADKEENGSRSLPLIKGPLVDYMYVLDEEEFFEGHEIVIEGKHGKWVWTVLDGTVEIVKETPKGQLKIVRIGTGAFIGSIASFFASSNVRSASAIATGNVQLGVLDSQRISEEFSKMSPEYKGLFQSLDMRLKRVTNILVDYYSGKNSLNKFIKKGKVLIKQGDNEERILTITEGEAYIVRQVDNDQIPLLKLERGDFFGSFPFLDMGQEPYSASVIASKNIKVKVAKRESLQAEHEQLPSVFKNILEHMATSISVTSMIACDLYKEFIAGSKK